VPSRLVVVGAGYIGLELGTALRKLGAQVTVVEMAERILPLYDAALTRPVAKRLEHLGVRVVLGSTAAAAAEGGGVVVTDGAGGQTTVPADVVLVTVGRRPALDGWGLEQLDLDRDGMALRIDDRCRTSMRGVWAIGDATGEPMLAHRAMAQGQLVAEVVAGQRRSWDERVIPEVCFTDPEIVSVGLSPDAAEGRGIATTVGTFALAANGRALTLGRPDGFVRVVARQHDHLLLGIQAVGAGVAELSGAFCTAVEMGAVLEDVAAIVAAHPTLGEAATEAAFAALGRSLHSR
jgi:dihydrolipoamide dehydrogenase